LTAEPLRTVLNNQSSRSEDGWPCDLALLRGIASGSEESFRILFRRWAPRLGSFLSRATSSREAGEDLLQEAFLRILQAAPRYTPRGEVSSWIYRICTNLTYSYWRREQRSPLRPGLRGIHDRAAVAQRENPEARRLRKAFTADVRTSLALLPVNQRMVFLLKVDQGLTYDEIASVLRCPGGTAKSRFHHAVRRLREDLKEWSDGFNDPIAPVGTTLIARRSQS